MYDKQIYKCDVTGSWPLTPVTNCHTFSDPSSVTYFMNGPLVRLLYAATLPHMYTCIGIHKYMLYIRALCAYVMYSK